MNRALEIILLFAILLIAQGYCSAEKVKPSDDLWSLDSIALSRGRISPG